MVEQALVPVPRLASGGDEEVAGDDRTFTWCSESRTRLSELNEDRLRGVSCTETAGNGNAISRGSFVVFGVVGVSEGCCRQK